MNQILQRADISCANSSAVTPPVGHYSHVCVAGGLVFISGQLPIQPDGTVLIGSSFEEQSAQVLANLEACLACAGVGKENLVQVRVYVTDIERWPLFNEIYAAWMGTHRPARAVAGVSQLHFGLAVELEAIALVTPKMTSLG
ncbi:RidA family protein [Pseudomonas sp. M30-35]|uniref:RidA family protein n=1 Tax=Pseudomonas sp. M30-35 TaxID=1981174 RepID=UPI000B3C2634|nr:RidA family protein [Pseudomonas sp. M30-35]ARU89887.1 RidA family protein [Pseudomonas sp. M30-35]